MTKDNELIKYILLGYFVDSNYPEYIHPLTEGEIQRVVENKFNLNVDERKLNKIIKQLTDEDLLHSYMSKDKYFIFYKITKKGHKYLIKEFFECI